MSSSQSAVSTNVSESDLLEKIRLAEVESSARLQEAKKEAERIIAKARTKANSVVQQSEEDARKEREKTIAIGNETIQAELQKVKAHADQQVDALKSTAGSPPNLKELVLSILKV